MKKQFLIFIMAPFLLGFTSQLHTAFADGELTGATSGQFGANRRVRTPDPDEGYTAVKGSFNIPQESDIYIPYLPSPRTFGEESFFVEDNRYRSKPSFYLGCSREVAADDEDGAGLEVDAGLQYESKPISLSSGNLISPGWSIFVRTTGRYTDRDGTTVNPRGAWRCGPGTSNSDVARIDLIWTYYKFASPKPPFYGGYLGVTALNTTGSLSAEQPKDQNYNDSKIRAQTSFGSGQTVSEIITDSVANTRVKRVVAITQGATENSPLEFPLPMGGVYQEDGSFFRNSTFNNGMVSKQRPTSTGDSWTPSVWNTWDALQTDVSDNSPEATGYYPGGFDHSIIGYTLRPPFVQGGATKTVVGHSIDKNKVFDFSGTTLPDRYANETISINLEPFIPALGFPIVVGGSKGSN